MGRLPKQDLQMLGGLFIAAYLHEAASQLLPRLSMLGIQLNHADVLVAGPVHSSNVAMQFAAEIISVSIFRLKMEPGVVTVKRLRHAIVLLVPLCQGFPNKRGVAR